MSVSNEYFLTKVTVTHTITSFPRRRESIVNFVIVHFRAVDSRGNDERVSGSDERHVCSNEIWFM